MYDKRVKRSALVFAAIFGLAGAFSAGVALAADSKLDDANDAITKAIALLRAADNPNVAHGPEFGGHRSRAIEKLEAAKGEIAKAKAVADRPVKAPPGPSSHPGHPGAPSPPKRPKAP